MSGAGSESNFMRLNLHMHAVLLMCRAIRNDPGKMVLQHGLANLYLRLGNEQAATVLLEKCLEVHKGQNTASSIALEALALDVNTCVERGRAIRDNTLQIARLAKNALGV